jgi:hypothetical protein
LGAPFGYFFQTTAYFFYGIGLLRVIEWVVTIMLFYDRCLLKRKIAAINIVKGIIVSFILDIPAIFWIYDNRRFMDLLVVEIA